MANEVYYIEAAAIHGHYEKIGAGTYSVKKLSPTEFKIIQEIDNKISKIHNQLNNEFKHQLFPVVPINLQPRLDSFLLLRYLKRAEELGLIRLNRERTGILQRHEHIRVILFGKLYSPGQILSNEDVKQLLKQQSKQPIRH